MPKIGYPSPERIVEYNILALELIKVNKADSPQVLSMAKLREVIEECENKEGDVYPDYAKAMVGIREGYYSDEEIKEWIKNGKI